MDGDLKTVRRLSSQVTVRDVRDRYGRSLLGIAARLVVVSMQYATLDSAQHNGPFTQLKLRGYRTCCMLSSSNHDCRISVHLLQVWLSGSSEILVWLLLVWHSLPNS